MHWNSFDFDCSKFWIWFWKPGNPAHERNEEKMSARERYNKYKYKKGHGTSVLCRSLLWPTKTIWHMTNLQATTKEKENIRFLPQHKSGEWLIINEVDARQKFFLHYKIETRLILRQNPKTNLNATVNVTTFNHTFFFYVTNFPSLSTGLIGVSWFGPVNSHTFYHIIYFIYNCALSPKGYY